MKAASHSGVSWPGETQPVERFFEFSLLGLLASGFLAVAGSGFLDAPTAAITASGLLLRGLWVAGALRFDISPRVVTAVTLAYIGFYPIDYLFVSKQFLAATVHLVFFLAVAKILTARTNRDYTYVKVIAFLELLAACILSASLNFFIFLALFLLFGVATYSSAEVRRSTQKPLLVVRGGMRRFHLRLAALTLSVSFGILAMTGGLFFLLPRTARAAFRHLVSSRYHLPGFSNEVVLGQIGEIKQQSTVVMHVRMYSGEHPAGLKWRGAALMQFDGHRWFNAPGPGEVLRVDRGMLRLADNTQRSRAGKRVSYEVHVQELAGDTIFIAGTPEFLQVNAPLLIRTPGGGYRSAFTSANGLVYGVYSYMEDALATREAVDSLPEGEREDDLRLPPIDPRIIALAREMTAGRTTQLAQARAIEDRLERDYTYTLELPKTEPRDPLANFLFERRRGHCEYFASSMAVMLRAIGIPSRVVTGFQSGVYNPISGWQLIRASDAHSWVEAWLPKTGWTTFDPTPPDPNPQLNSLMMRLSLYADAADTFWQEWVLNYDLDRQLILAARMGESSRNAGTNWADGFAARAGKWGAGAADQAVRYGPAAVVGLAAAFLLFAYGESFRNWWTTRRRVRKVQRGEVAAGDATLLYLRMLGLLKRRGIEKPSWLTPFEFARVLQKPELAAVVDDLTVAYNHLRYGGDRQAAGRMVGLLERLEKL